MKTLDSDYSIDFAHKPESSELNLKFGSKAILEAVPKLVETDSELRLEPSLLPVNIIFFGGLVICCFIFFIGLFLPTDSPENATLLFYLPIAGGLISPVLAAIAHNINRSIGTETFVIVNKEEKTVQFPRRGIQLKKEDIDQVCYVISQTRNVVFVIKDENQSWKVLFAFHSSGSAEFKQVNAYKTIAQTLGVPSKILKFSKDGEMKELDFVPVKPDSSGGGM